MAAAPPVAEQASVADPSGVPMPVGNLAATSGTWQQIWADDFSTPQTGGAFPGVYRDLTAYSLGTPDTSRRGVYNPGIISFHDGALDVSLHSVNGVPQVAAILPVVNGRPNSLISGRYTIRFKADPLPGYKLAWLLWPNSNVWSQGEIDFPEANLDQTMNAFNHCPGNPTVNCLVRNTSTPFGGWHTATIEWKAGQSVSYFLDGVLIAADTNPAEIPTAPMRWVIQTETSLNEAVSAAADGHVLIDWASIYAWVPA